MNTLKLVGVFIIGFIVGGIVFHCDFVEIVKEKLGYNDYLSPYEVSKHPHKYLNKIITVKGVLNGNMIVEKNPLTDEEWNEAMTYGLLARIPENITVIPHAEYLFTGKLIQGPFSQLTLVVSKVEPI